MAMSTTVRTNLPFTTRKLHPSFGLEVTGLDVSGPLDAATIELLTRLFSEYKLVVFKGQDLTTASLNGFAQYFGDTNLAPPRVPGQEDRARPNNVDIKGNRESKDQPHREPTGYGLAARHWHTDSSWRPVPTWLTFLAAGELPDKDGDTGFADLEAAYEALSPERKALLADKQMVHSWRTLRRYEPSIAPMGDDENVPPPVCHPVVRTVEGRKVLYVNGHVCYYVGNMPLEEGKALFNELLAHATSAPFTYHHKWSLGDLAVWDGRTTLHRATPYDTRQRRVMYRAEVVGTEAPR